MFLKTIGSIVLKITTFAIGIQQFLPAKLQTSEGKFISELQQIGGVIITAEGMVTAISPNASGEDKLNAATPYVANIVHQSEAMLGKKVKNEAIFIRGCRSIASGVADILNSVE